MHALITGWLVLDRTQSPTAIEPILGKQHFQVELLEVPFLLLLMLLLPLLCTHRGIIQKLTEIFLSCCVCMYICTICSNGEGGNAFFVPLSRRRRFGQRRLQYNGWSFSQWRVRLVTSCQPASKPGRECPVELEQHRTGFCKFNRNETELPTNQLVGGKERSVWN